MGPRAGLDAVEKRKSSSPAGNGVRSEIVIDDTVLEQINMLAYFRFKISYEKDTASKISFTYFGNSEQIFENKFSPKPVYIESIKYLSYAITFIWL
jgi:hypothetical protein